MPSGGGDAAAAYTDPSEGTPVRTAYGEGYQEASYRYEEDGGGDAEGQWAQAEDGGWWWYPAGGGDPVPYRYDDGAEATAAAAAAAADPSEGRRGRRRDGRFGERPTRGGGGERVRGITPRALRRYGRRGLRRAVAGGFG